MELIQHLVNNNSIIIILLRLFFSIIQSILFLELSSSVLNIKNSKKSKCKFLAIVITTGIASIFLGSSILKDIVNIVAFLLSMYFIIKQSIKNSFIALVSSYLCALVTEYLSLCIITSISNCSYYDITAVPMYFFLGNIVSFLLYTFIIIIINIVKKLKIQNISKHIPLNITVIINLILGILTMILESYLLAVYKEAVPFNLVLTILITLLLYFIISMYSIIRTNTLEKTEEDLQNEILYNKTLTLLHDNIRCFKHDFNNIVQIIGGYIALNDMEGLSIYYKKLLNECELTNNLNLLNPNVINNPSIYSLLTNKYYLALQKNIDMTFSVFTDLSNINNCNMYELSRILGILLDNAIEAAEETEDRKIEIEFNSDTKKQNFIIRNSCKDSNISITKIFEKGYSTKERNSGIGLWKVHKILSKNTNLNLFTTVKNNIFCQQLEVYYGS